MKTNMKGNKMSKKKTVRYSDNWYAIANDKHDFRSMSKNYKKSCELINIDHTFGSMIKLKEYNKSLYKLWEFLSKDENKHIIKTLSKQDMDFYFDDLPFLYFQISQLTEAGLEDEKNLDDWTVFSGGHVGRKSEQDNVKGVN